MKFDLLISEEARDQLRAMPPELRKAIGVRLQQLETDFSGDVKKLTGRRNHFRLRVGTYRVLFRLEGSRIEVYPVKQRKEAYE